MRERWSEFGQLLLVKMWLIYYDALFMSHNKWFLHYSCWRGMIRVPSWIINPLLTFRIPKFSSRTSSDDSLSDSASTAAFSSVWSSVFVSFVSPSRITLVIKWINANIGKFPLIWRGNKGFWLRNGDDTSSVETFERFNSKLRVRLGLYDTRRQGSTDQNW